MPELIIRTESAGPEILQARAEKMDQVEKLCLSQVQWYECSTPAEYRRQRLEGLNGFVKPQFYGGARTIYAPARDGHLIELRIIQAVQESRGVLLHFHAGGFTIGSARSYDNYLLHLSKSLQVTAVSTEYRLAPEHSYPTPHHDCSDAVLFALSRDGEAQLGGPLRMLAGESAGATLAVSVALALRDRPGFDLQSQISSMLLSYGVFDMTGTPSLLDHKREAVVGTVGMKKFIEAAFSHVPPADRKNPDISPLFMDLSNLPPALFLCGTEDPLLDDSNFMASRWSMAGNVTEVSLIPGGWHGFTIIPAGEITDHGLDELVRFGLKHL